MTRMMGATAITLSMTGMAFAEAHSGMFPNVEVHDGQAYLASTLMGTRIYAVDQEYEIGSMLPAGTALDWDDIGEIGDVVISAEGQLEAIIIDVGGFLGLGEREVAVSWDSIRPVTEDDDPSEVFLTIGATEETLNTAPEFDRMGMADEAMMESDAEVTPTPGLTESVEGAEEAEIVVEERDAEAEEVEVVVVEGDTEMEAEAEETMVEVEGAADEAMTETAEAVEETEMAVEGAAEEVEAETEEAMAETGEALEEAGDAVEAAGDEVMAETAEAVEETEMAVEGAAAEVEAEAAESMETTTETVEVETVEVEGDAMAETETVEADTEVVVVEDADMATERTMLRTPMFEREGFMTAELDQLTSEDLTGMRLYDPTDEDIGEISELIMAADGTSVESAILDIGGFLGLGEHQVLVTMDELQILRGEDGGYRAYIDATQEELEAQPEYEG